MSTTLNLVDRLSALGRNYQELGRSHDALHVFSRLAGFLELPAEVAEETQARLAEIHLRRRKYAKARRHLTAALHHRPDSARYHSLMGAALDADGKGDAERAAEHYRRALELEPDQPQCLGEYGLLAVRLGQTDEGLKCLRRAAELAPDDPAAAKRLAKGLESAGRPDEARLALQTARFRNPRDARFRRLWDDFQFDQLRKAQEAERQGRVRAANAEDGPVILPFVRPSEPRPPGRRRARLDHPAPTPPPHAPHTAWLPRRRVQ